jgi:hypothetical protein
VSREILIRHVRTRGAKEYLADLIARLEAAEAELAAAARGSPPMPRISEGDEESHLADQQK